LFLALSPLHLMSLIFFFQCSGHHRHLHSFPTRRSSDLYPAYRAVGFVATGMAKGAEDALASIKVLAAMLLFPLTWTGVERAASRSEEHTSELQSRGHLVCRLLLEKKNKLAWRD